MAKASTSSVLNRLAGKKICFTGKFDRGLQERLEGMAKAQQGQVQEDLDASVNFVVLQDLNAGKTVQKKALSLNAKGASMQMIDADSFRKLAYPTEAEILALIRGGTGCAQQFVDGIGEPRAHFYYRQAHFNPLFTFVGENFDGLDLAGFVFDQIVFEQCSFAGTNLPNVNFISAKNCNFTGAKLGLATFGDVDGSKFVKADLKSASFMGTFLGTDFTHADLGQATFFRHTHTLNVPKPLRTPGCVFAQANLRRAKFNNMQLVAPDFDGATLAEAAFGPCIIEQGSFRNAKLTGASFMGCGLSKANFSGAECSMVNFADADLTEARFDGADLANCNFHGAKTQGVDFSKARNYDPSKKSAGTIGPALTELDSIAQQAQHIRVTFRVRTDPAEEGDEVSIDTVGLKHGWGINIPHSMLRTQIPPQRNRAFSEAMLLLASLVMNRKVRFETLTAETTKSPKSGKELKALLIAGISEGFAQPIPPAEELTAATKAYKDQLSEKGAEARKQREEAKQQREQAKQKELKKIEKTIEKKVGKVTDIATFLKALELRADKAKISKATSMLKAERFKLFNDITDKHLSGVIKSQTDPDLVYACRIEADGKYCCCTQNLNICGGLRGSICKHLLVLIVGLVQAGQLDPSTIDGWISKTHNVKPALDKEIMGEIFIRYKGAEAGEVDWRPTETVPEDYYAV